jgi:hypothetical protein
MAQRQYEATQIFNVRCVDMRHLWNPSDTYKGQKTQKPNYFAIFIAKKTAAHWSQEPVFGGVMQAFAKLMSGPQLQGFGGNYNMVQWPIGDGDLPNAEGKSSEFAKGHWIFSASSGNPPNVEMVQAGGNLVKLQNKIGVKSGDYCMVGVTCAVKANQPNGVKFYLNAAVFTSPGEEIVFANSVSGAELMRMAEAQGLRPTGFAPSAGGFAPQGGGAGFTPGNPNFVPAPGPATFAPPPNGTAGGAFAPQPGSGATGYPSNPQGGPSFTPPAVGPQPGPQWPVNNGQPPFPGQR